MNPLALQRLRRNTTMGILGTAALFALYDKEGALMTAAAAIVKKISKVVVCKTEPATRQSLQVSVEWDTNTVAEMAAGQHTVLNAGLLAMGGTPGALRAPRTRGGAVAAEEAKRMYAL